MYNKSYKGYRKSYKYKFKSRKNKSKKEFTLSLENLKFIKYLAVFLAVCVAVFVVSFGVSLYRNNNSQKLQNSTADTLDDNSQLLMIVNKNNLLESTYIPQLTKVRDVYVNTLMVDNLNAMLKDAEDENISLKIKCGYISYENQEKIFNRKYNELLNKNDYSKVMAEAKTQAIIPKAGASEHQTGLLLEFATDEKVDFKDSSASKWLERNSINYGFVLRYTEDKRGQTFMDSSDTLYRYVGISNAKMMRSFHMCLNEYVYYISSRE